VKLTIQLHLVPIQNAWSYTARFTYTYTEWYLVTQGDDFATLCTLKWGWEGSSESLVATKLHGATP